MENENIIWFERPELNSPFLILAFQGWANAGEVPSSILWYLISQLQASLFAELKTDRFYSYQTTGTENKRPIVNIENGIIQSYSLITTNFWYYKAGIEGRDVIFGAGPEPEQDWTQFSGTILDLAQEYDVEKIIALGGTFDSVPHTVPPKITGVVSCSDLREDLERYQIEPVNYKGPSSILTFLMVNASRKNIPMINLWAHTPHYIQVVNFMACYALMQKLTEMLGLPVDLEMAQKDSEFLRAQVDDAIEKKPELQEYLHTLEAEYHHGPSEKNTKEEPISKNIIKEIEDLFKDKPG